MDDLYLNLIIWVFGIGVGSVFTALYMENKQSKQQEEQRRKEANTKMWQEILMRGGSDE